MRRNQSWAAFYSRLAGNPNKNVNWIGGRGTWTAYALCVLAVRFLLSWFPLSAAVAWTTTHVLHGLVRARGKRGRARVPAG